MNLSDYIIDHSHIAWPTVLRDWLWLIPPRLTVWIMNRFGDLFVVLDDGTVHRLDVAGGTFTRVANNRDEFMRDIDVGDNANQWLMIPLVDELVASGVKLADGQCYGYRIPPVLGGNFTVENAHVLPISEHFRFHASVHQQIKDLPDGARVAFEITNGEN